MPTAPLPLPEPLAPLSRREHRYLWLMSQGYTPREAQKLMNTTSTSALSTRTRDKLHAVTMEHAVYIACQADLLGPYEDCGWMPGYTAHHGRHEEPCRACREFFISYTDRQEAPPLRQPRLTEAEVRMLRAYDCGRTFKSLLATWGCSRRTLDDLRTSLYRKLDVAHLPQSAKYRAALDEGRRRGYLKPVHIVREDVPNPHRWGTTDLTDLELRTLSAVADGSSLAQAGLVLGIPGSSVSSRLARVYKKMGVLDRDHGQRREAAVSAARSRGYSV